MRRVRLPSPVPGSSPAARCLVQNGRDAGSGHAMAPFCLLLPHALALRSSEMCHGRTPQAGHGRTPRLALSLAYRMVPRPHPSPTTRPRPHHRRPHRPQARHRCLTTLLWCRSAFLQALACQGCRAVHEGRIRVGALCRWSWVYGCWCLGLADLGPLVGARSCKSLRLRLVV